MPNPFSKVIPGANLYFANEILSDKPQMAILVANIFAVWASIEIELSFLLVRLLGADAKPALEMFDTLTAQHLQLGALDAAARAALSPDDYDIFVSATAIADRVQTPRNHLAHWQWCGCEQQPELLGLADPKLLKKNDKQEVAILAALRMSWMLEIDGYDPEWIDPEHVLAYSQSDLERALRDLNECLKCISLISLFLRSTKEGEIEARNPAFLDVAKNERALAIGELNKLRLFREALAQTREARQKREKSSREQPQSDQGN